MSMITVVVLIALAIGFAVAATILRRRQPLGVVLAAIAFSMALSADIVILILRRAAP